MCVMIYNKYVIVCDQSLITYLNTCYGCFKGEIVNKYINKHLNQMILKYPYICLQIHYGVINHLLSV